MKTFSWKQDASSVDWVELSRPYAAAEMGQKAPDVLRHCFHASRYVCFASPGSQLLAAGRALGDDYDCVYLCDIAMAGQYGRRAPICKNPLTNDRVVKMAVPDARVLVALQRPADYLDVHPNLVIEDALQEGAPWEFLRDEGKHVVVALTRPEGCERAAAKSLAAEFIRATWPAGHIVKQ